MRADPFYTDEVINDLLPANHRLNEQLTEKQLEDLKKPREIAARLNIEDAKAAAEKVEAAKAALHVKTDAAAAELESVPITDEFSASAKERCNRIRAALIKSDGTIRGAAKILGLKYATLRYQMLRFPKLFEKYAKNGKCGGKGLLWLKPEASKPADGKLNPASSAV
jgi:transcriptional regulator with GAF, ATPase, and Fis domain